MLKHPIFNVFCCLLLLLSWATQWIQPLAQADEKANRYNDGWRLSNPPKVIHRTDEVPHFWKIEIKTRPLVEELPSETHPLMRDLNYYYQFTFEPSAELIQWNQHVETYHQNKTPDFMGQFEKRYFSMPNVSTETMSLMALDNPDVSKTPAKKTNHATIITETLKKIGGLILAIPAILVILPLCGVALIGYGVVLHIDDKKYKKERQVTELKKVLFPQAQPFIHKIESLQQTFNPDTHLNATWDKPYHNMYYLPPHLDLYTFYPKEKKAVFKASDLLITFKFKFKTLHPLQHLRQNLSQATPRVKLSIDDIKGIYYDSSVISYKAPSGQYVDSCVLKYQGRDLQPSLSCQVYTHKQRGR